MSNRSYTYTRRASIQMWRTEVDVMMSISLKVDRVSCFDRNAWMQPKIVPSIHGHSWSNLLNVCQMLKSLMPVGESATKGWLVDTPQSLVMRGLGSRWCITQTRGPAV